MNDQMTCETDGTDRSGTTVRQFDVVAEHSGAVLVFGDTLPGAAVVLADAAGLSTAANEQPSDRALLADAMAELLNAQRAGVRVLGSFARSGQRVDELAERRERRAARSVLAIRDSGGAA